MSVARGLAMVVVVVTLACEARNMADLPGDASPSLCLGSSDHTPTVAAIDPVTRCPGAVDVVHRYSRPDTCDDVRVCCDFPPTCTFGVTVRYFIPGACNGREQDPPRTDVIADCQCVDGRVRCAGRPEAISSSCLDCNLGRVGDGGR